VTLFSSDERVAGALRSGRCFLVGDAAHVHSPIGGQGLNLGIPDTRNWPGSSPAWCTADCTSRSWTATTRSGAPRSRRPSRPRPDGPAGRGRRGGPPHPRPHLAVAPGLRRAGPRLCADAGRLAQPYRTCCFGDPAGGTYRSRPRPGTRIPMDPHTFRRGGRPVPADHLRSSVRPTHGRGSGVGRPVARAGRALPAGRPDAAVRAAAPDGYVAASGDADRFTGVAAKLAALVPPRHPGGDAG